MNVYHSFESERGSTSTVSTNWTEPNLPGTGRTLGNLYDHIGRLIEAGARKLKRDPTQGSVGRLAIDVTHSASTSSITVSTNSTNFTADDLPGAGRTLGLVYRFLGAKLEQRANKIVSGFGHGPDNAMVRIRAAAGMPTDRDLFRIAFAYQDFSMLPEDVQRVVQKECRKLLKYSQSKVHENQLQALSHLIDLATSGPFFRSIFLHEGAREIIQPLGSQLLQLRGRHVDLLLSASRKALVSLEEVEVNSTAQHLYRDSNTPNLSNECLTYMEKERLYRLAEFVRDPSVSFLALRHLIQTGIFFPMIQANLETCLEILCFTVCNSISLADSFSSDTDYVEWDLLDNWLLQIISNFHTGIHNFLNLSSWKRAFLGILRYAPKFPLTVAALPYWTDIIRSHIFGGKFLAYRQFRVASTFSFFIEALCFPSPQTFERSLCLPIILWKHKKLLELAYIYNHKSLRPFWKVVTSLSDILLSTILVKKIHFSIWQSEENRHLCQVFTGPDLDDICHELVLQLDSPGEHAYKRAMQCIEMVITFDHFCAKAMIDALVTHFSSSLLSELPRKLLSIEKAQTAKPDNPPYPQTPFLYRHRLPNGDIHLRKTDPYIRLYPCDSCVEAGTWDDWLESRDIYEELLSLTQSGRDFLLLHIGPGTRFDAAASGAVFAGVNEMLGKPVYVGLHGDAETLGMDRSYFPLLDGTTYEEHLAETGMTHLAVVVLSTPGRDWMEEEIRGWEGYDATGPYFWRIVPESIKYS